MSMDKIYKVLSAFSANNTIRLLNLLEGENMQYKTAIKLLLYTGLRREEICGLEWSDIVFIHSVITVQRASLYIPKNVYTEESGIITDTTKNESSIRDFNVSGPVIPMLKEYKEWQMKRRLQLGDRWEDHDRLFTTDTGTPIHPDTLTNWFTDFIKRNGLPHVTIHGLRHPYVKLKSKKYCIFLSKYNEPSHLLAITRLFSFYSDQFTVIRLSLSTVILSI